jgi:uncharacterized protein YqeY
MLEEKILNDYKEALKARDTLKISLLSCLRAEFLNAQVAKKKTSLDDTDIIVIVKKQIKQHQDSIEQFKSGKRDDLAAKEIKELEILKIYLPPQISDTELKAIIEEIVKSIGAQGLKDMGKVMKEATARIGQSADSKLISDLVKSKLSATP